MNSASVLAGDLRVHDDDEVGGIDRRDRREIAHQLVFALRRRHQRFIRRLGVRHHQERVAVGRRFDDFLRADHAAGAGAVLDHDRLAELLLQHVADQARRHVGGPSGAEGNDDPDRPRSGNPARNRGRQDMAVQKGLPANASANLGALISISREFWSCSVLVVGQIRRKSLAANDALSTKDSLCPIGIKDNFWGTKSRPNKGTIR